jgi:hypothetical protein
MFNLRDVAPSSTLWLTDARHSAETDRGSRSLAPRAEQRLVDQESNRNPTIGPVLREAAVDDGHGTVAGAGRRGKKRVKRASQRL